MNETILLEDLEIYQLALEIGEYAWNVVDKWEFFQKKSIGGQFVESGGLNCCQHC